MAKKSTPKKSGRRASIGSTLDIYAGPITAWRQAPRHRRARKLDEATLRRFVFQTFGRARRTQDSPVMPDVWLRYIRVAEAIAQARIHGGSNPPRRNGSISCSRPGRAPGQARSRSGFAINCRMERRLGPKTSRTVDGPSHGLRSVTAVWSLAPISRCWSAISSHCRTGGEFAKAARFGTEGARERGRPEIRGCLQEDRERPRSWAKE